MAAPRVDIWGYMIDPHRLAALNPDSVGIDAVHPAGPLQSGQHWVEHAHSPLGLQNLETRVATVDAERGVIEIQANGPFGLHITSRISLTPVTGDNGQTIVVFEHRCVWPSGPLRAVIAGVIGARMRAGTDTALHRLARAVEGATPSGSSATPT